MIRNVIVTLLLFFVSAWITPSKAQSQASDMPDFKEYFRILRDNRVLYNSYNDSIFLIHDHNKWIDFFRRRSRAYHRLYDWDAAIINNISSYFQQNSDSIQAEAYLKLFDEYRNYVVERMYDPFLNHTFSGILQKGIPLLPDSLNYSNIIHLWRLSSYLQMFNLGGNEAFLKRAYTHWKFLMSDEAKKYPYYDYAYSRAFRYLNRTMWLIFKLQTVDEYKSDCRKLNALLAREDIDQVVTPEVKAELKEVQEQEDEALVRNVYMIDSTLMKQNHGEELMRKVVAENLANPELPDLSYIRTLYMQMWLGQITPQEAWDKWMVRYNMAKRKIKSKQLNNNEFLLFLKPFYTFSYINYKLDVPEAKKHKNALMMCEDMEMAYLHRKDQQSTTDFVRDLSRSVSDKWMVYYLTPEERVRFVNSLTVATNLPTYAHSMHVAKIAEIMMEAIIRYRPDLLKGELGCQQVSEVVAHKKDFINFIRNASMYHDVGKNSIASVVNNEYRPLTIEEDQIIMQHPALALRYLNLAPELTKYHDTTLGHHKWYNGKGGYPDDFDNTKSPVRILIDIVTLSDCIQAATEKVSRNYRYEKPFDVVMWELKAGAGTQYNPDLVAMIDEHPELVDKLSWETDEGWLDIYYDIYKKYFQK